MLADDQFIRGKVPMTKEEVRAVVIAKGCLRKDSTVIDIGAGTGSLSIQAALMVPDGQVFAIEQNQEGIELIKANGIKHSIRNMEIIFGRAPGALAALPDADTIFIGGSGGELQEIITSCHRILTKQGRLVITSVTISTLTTAIDMLTMLGYELDIAQIAVTKYLPVNEHLMAKAQNPIFIITGSKEEADIE